MSDVADDHSIDPAAAAVADEQHWYHSIELRPGVVTPGWFDLRPIVDRLPWPDVRGKRCLDVGTYDGFLAFELERRGAKEVIATDVGSHEDWDWPPALRAQGVELLKQIAGEKGRNFEVARELRRSSVTKRIVSVYDLSPASLGTFDVVVCGSLLLHLRDPMRALESIHSVCTGRFMSCEAVDPWLSLGHPRRPLTTLAEISLVQWHVPNVAGHRAMVAASGFDIERTVRPYSIPFGRAHPPRGRGLRGSADRLAKRLLTGSDGVPHSALLARPIATA